MAKASRRAKTKPKAQARAKGSPKAKAKAKPNPKAKAKAKARTKAAAPARRFIDGAMASIDLWDATTSRIEDVPSIATSQGKPIVAWAVLHRMYNTSEEPKVWLAMLAAPAGKIVRSFVDRVSSTGGYEIICDDPFVKINRYRQEHPLIAGVYEASSAHAGIDVFPFGKKPPKPTEGYRGRAAFEVAADGAIDIIAVGAWDKPFPKKVQSELIRRAAGDTMAAKRHGDAEGEKLVRGDALMQEHDLPSLYGSEKQVRWAMDIRQRFVEGLLRVEDAKEKLNLMNRVKKQTAARFWIDNREAPLPALREE